MAELKLVVTKIGLAKITEATIENPLKLTHFAVGDGNGAPIEPNENMTGLVNEKYRDVLNDTYANENNLTIECVLRANAPITQGFKIFELGIFDEAGDMIAISQTPEQYRPIPSEGIATEWIASVVLQLSNTDNITIEIPETVFATTDALQREVEDRNTMFRDFFKGFIGTILQTPSENPLLFNLKLIQYLKCEGQSLNKSSYPDLFAVLGYTWGGEGNIFKLPDTRNRSFRNIGKDMELNYKEDSIQDFSGRIDSYTTGKGSKVPLVLNNAVYDEKGVLKPKRKSSTDDWFRLKTPEENPDMYSGTGVAGNLVFSFEDTNVRVSNETTGKVYAGVSYIIAKVLV